MTAPSCRHFDHELVRRRASNGAWGVVEWCHDCKNIVSKHFGHPGVWIGQGELRSRGVDVDALPIVGDRPIWRTCEGPCGRLAMCEEHHFAPREHFGDEADDWPRGWLCAECHGKWHLRMGRNIGRRSTGAA